MKTLLDVFAKASRHTKQAFYTKDSHKYFRQETFPQIYEKSAALTFFLQDQGVQHGDRVAIFSDNRIEWLISDIAICRSAAVSVPRGSDSTAQEIKYILEHSGAKLVIIEHLRLYKKIAALLMAKKLPVLVLDAKFPEKISTEQGFYRFHDVLAKYLKQVTQKEKNLLDLAKTVGSDDLFTIIYTSGTTGKPKGVMLTHANMIYQVETVPQFLELDSKDRILSILPVWHIFERFMLYCVIDSGACLYYTNPKDLMEDFIRVKPTIMASAPRLWEQVYHKLHDRIEKTEALNRELFHISYTIKQELHRAKNRLLGNTIAEKPKNLWDSVLDKAFSLLASSALQLPDMYMDSIFLMKVRAMLGGELRGTLSGGGALPKHIDEFFNAIGIPVYEGYGMTECSPLISLRSKGKIIEGTVGFTPPGTTVKLVKEDGSPAEVGEKGVIHVQGPGVMKGYYKNPEETAKTIRDGWLDTGDIGIIYPNGALSLQGRAKETIVLLSGENVEPVPIETILTQHTLVEQAVVVGQDEKHLGVLVWPNYEKIKDAGFVESEYDWSVDLNQKKDLIKLYLSAIHELISGKNGFKSFERVTAIRFLPEKLQVGSTLTNLKKIKRNVVHDKYRDLIRSMYGA
ncbi:MAG: AMP-binding protein [Spirochaetota bacterium]